MIQKRTRYKTSVGSGKSGAIGDARVALMDATSEADIVRVGTEKLEPGWPWDAGTRNVQAKIANKTIPYVSLFTGAMGLDLGLEQQGFQAAVCNEIDPECAATIRNNRPHVPLITECVERINEAKLSEAAQGSVKNTPLVAGGPPCQAFSVYGRRKGVCDERGRLIFEFVRLVEEIRPHVFLMENVRGLHSMSIVPRGERNDGDEAKGEMSEPGSLLREILRRFEAIGYRVDCFLVNVVNYGGPQIRERLICVGNRYNLETDFPPAEFSNRPEDGLKPFRTLGDIIGPGSGFQDPDPTIMNFSPRKLKYLSMVPPGGNWRGLPVAVQKESMGKAWYLKGGRSAYWRKLAFEFPCPTVVTMPNHAGTSMCHPSELRALSVGECAAVQEFPREWGFAGPPAAKYRQVGNAVPPRLGAVVGGVVRRLLHEIEAAEFRRAPGTNLPSTIRHIRPHVRTRSFWREGKALAGNHSYIQRRSHQLPLFP